MTAGREQDARETLREAVVEADERPYEPQLVAVLEAARAALAAAALLPSPPATTDECERLRADLLAAESDRDRNAEAYISASLQIAEMWEATTGSDDGPKVGILEDLRAIRATSSPPATDGDAADDLRDRVEEALADFLHHCRVGTWSTAPSDTLRLAVDFVMAEVHRRAAPSPATETGTR